MKPQIHSAGGGVVNNVGAVTASSPLIQSELRHGASNYDPLPVVMAHGEGVWLWDEHGRRYLDMLSAYSAVSHGHAHPRIVQALIAQAQRYKPLLLDSIGILLGKGEGVFQDCDRLRLPRIPLEPHHGSV